MRSLLNLSFPRLIVVVVLLVTALILQSSILAAVGLPGATPDALLVVALGLAMATGPVPGVVIGFAAGVLVDIAPPATSSLGQTAAIYALAGFVAGHVELSPGRPDIMCCLTVTGLSAAAVAGQAALGLLLGTASTSFGGLISMMLTQALYAAILSVVILPLVALLYRGAAEDGRRFA